MGAAAAVVGTAAYWMAGQVGMKAALVMAEWEMAMTTATAQVAEVNAADSMKVANEAWPQVIVGKELVTAPSKVDVTVEMAMMAAAAVVVAVVMGMGGWAMVTAGALAMVARSR